MVTSVSSNTTSLVSQLFSRLDTKSQGYLEKSDLVSAFSAIGSSDSSSADSLFAALDGNSDGKVTESEFSSTISALQQQLDSQFTSMRMQGRGGQGPQGMAGGMPPPPPQNDSGFTQDELQSQLDTLNSSGSTDSKRADLLNEIVNNFSAADSDGDGKVSFKEAMAYDQSQNGTTASTSDTGSTPAAGMPPPPPQNDTGFTQEELQSQLDQLNSSGTSDSKRAQLLQEIVSNFSAADSDGDGKVSFKEAKAYDESQKSDTSGTSATSSSASNSNNDVQLMMKIVQLMRAYGALDSTENTSSLLSTSA